MVPSRQAETVHPAAWHPVHMASVGSKGGPGLNPGTK